MEVQPAALAVDRNGDAGGGGRAGRAKAEPAAEQHGQQAEANDFGGEPVKA